jgi:membrane protein
MLALWKLLKKTVHEWMEDKAMKLAASLSYYTAFSLAPLLVIVVALLSFIYGQQAAEGQVARELRLLIGGPAAQATQEIVKSASQRGGGVMATIVSVIILIFGASAVFGELQDSMNIVWEVQPKPDRGIKDVIKDRFFSMTMVFGIVFLLLVSLIISTLISTLSARWTSQAHWVARGIDLIMSVGIVAVLFAMLFKFLPDAKIRWRDVWLGGILTSVLFTIGKYLLTLYLSKTSTMSAYGATGSFAALLIWVYYSAQILFFGAEFTQVYSRQYGSKPKPAENALPLTEEKREQQGIGHDRQKKARQAMVPTLPIVPRPRPRPLAPLEAQHGRQECLSHQGWKQAALAGGGLIVGYLAKAAREAKVEERVDLIEKRIQRLK